MTDAPVIAVLPSSVANAISGVFAGIATTSKTTSAARTACSGNDSASASAPPDIPIGVALISTPGRSSPSSACQSKPYCFASDDPTCWLRAITVTSVNPVSRTAATTAFAMPPLPATATDRLVSTSLSRSRSATA